MGKYNWEEMKASLQGGIGEKKDDFNDVREWKLQRDEKDNGTAIIRLLPGKDGSTPPVVRIFEHSVRIFNKQTNKYRYYIQPSPSSIGDECPVSEVWYELGEVGTDEAKKHQETFKRSVKFISNILVVNDPAEPGNNGKVFYWKYGVKLFEKFQGWLEPTEAQQAVGKKPIELFDPEAGANITLDVKKVGNFINYDDTSVDSPSVISENKTEIEDIIENKCYDMTEFISKDYYKPYGELKQKLSWTLEKSPEEEFLIEHNSKVISSKFSSKKSEKKEDYQPTPKSEPNKPEPEQTEKIKETQTDEKEAKSQTDEEAEILAMIEEL